MRILFVYKKPSIDIRDPLGLLYIISVAKEAGHKCSLLIYDLEKYFFEKAVRFNPDVICYSVTTGAEDEYLKINSLLKEKKLFFSVFGGPHPTFYPDFLRREGVDSICRGESEGPFREFLAGLESGRDFYNTPNFWFKKKGELIKNDLGPLQERLDGIPFPDRDFINAYFDYKKYGRIDVITGRGCPFDCAYCFNHKLKEYYSGKGTYVRKRGVDNVIAEIKACTERYKIKEIYFVDDLFVVSKKWLAEFAEKYKREVNLPYICNIRADVFTEEMSEYLKESNCRFVGFAIESGNHKLRKEILNRTMSNEDIYDTCGLLKKHKIGFGVGNMLGLPYETMDNAFETVQLNVRCRPNHSWVSMLQPYPNTELYNFSVRNNLLKDGYSIRSDYHSSSPFKSKYNNEFENLHNLFAICVDFPVLIPLVRHIIKLPKNRFFEVLHDLYKFFCYIRIGQIRANYPFIKNSITMYSLKLHDFLKLILVKLKNDKTLQRG